jgi:hypothetical protein
MTKRNLNIQFSTNGKSGIESVNPGYAGSDLQAKQRAQSYSLTQRLIVDKEPFFKEILEIMKEKDKKRVSFLEPGIGPGFFLEYLILNQFFRNKEGIYHAADISEGMLSYTMTNIINIFPNDNNGSKLSLDLTGKVNCIDPDNTFYGKVLEQGRMFDCVFSSQFHHYLPNSESSPLGVKLSEEGIPFLTKSAYTQFCYDIFLCRDGRVIIIDDFIVGDDKNHQQNQQEWDAYFINNVLDEENISWIEERDKNLAAHLKKAYNVDKNMERMLRFAKKTRESRRVQCNEEIETIESAFESMNTIFGEENVQMYAHPDLNNFYMLIGQKR